METAIKIVDVRHCQSGRTRYLEDGAGYLPADRKRPVQKLSKGMKGRLALARAVLHHPDLYGI